MSQKILKEKSELRKVHGLLILVLTFLGKTSFKKRRQKGTPYFLFRKKKQKRVGGVLSSSKSYQEQE